MEEPDDLVAELIIQKLKSASVVVSFAEVAREAKARNRNRLAAQVHTWKIVVITEQFDCKVR